MPFYRGRVSSNSNSLLTGSHAKRISNGGSVGGGAVTTGAGGATSSTAHFAVDRSEPMELPNGPYRTSNDYQRSSFSHPHQDRYEDVADQEVIFDGPSASSVPSSLSAFAHRRDSSATLAAGGSPPPKFFAEEFDLDAEEALTEASVAETDTERSVDTGRAAVVDTQEQVTSAELESGRVPLLEHRQTLSHASDAEPADIENRTTQKMYLEEEDLIIVITGFKEFRTRGLIYHILCVATFGLLYLLLRWMPRWKLRLLAKAVPLVECEWVVVESQWQELTIHSIGKTRFNQPMSMLFGSHRSGDRLKHGNAENEMLDDENILDTVRFLDYRYVRFIFHPLRHRFVALSDWRDERWKNPAEVRKGLDTETKESYKNVMGANLIDIEQRPIIKLLVDEILHPFYIFQVASIVLWSFDNYYYYATCIFLISVVSISTTLAETRRTETKMNAMSRFECNIRVLRGQFWSYVASSDLVPGDVYEVSDPELSILPCDALLLSGDCILNESMLTGESIPVSKTPASETTLQSLFISRSQISADVAKHFLFAGTKLIRVRRPQGNDDEASATLAVVIRTGFNTTKGALVRSMLFPRPNKFKFYRDSFRFIAAMAMIAGIGFIASAVNFVELQMPASLIIVRALDLITIIVPPALPATLTIGTSFALSRLKAKSIFCISPNRVNISGKVDVMCFDKTGTLTEEGLDVLGVRPVKGNKFIDLCETSEDLNDSHSDGAEAVLKTMTTCHSLKLIEDDIIGDPLDIKMFQYTRWSLEEGNRKWSYRKMGDNGNEDPQYASQATSHEQEYSIASPSDTPEETEKVPFQYEDN